ncbi:MAG: hypothetical protein MUE51_10160 [Thermoleophilia bacterium]|jgi:hypothetical protein|nr:hypothetical protein [Thermoleophilia bacterium]
MTDWTAHRISEGPLRGVTLQTRRRSALARLARMLGIRPRRPGHTAPEPAEDETPAREADLIPA